MTQIWIVFSYKIQNKITIHCMYLFILLILNFIVYKYLYNNFYKTSDQLIEYTHIKNVLDKIFMIPGKIL